MPMSTHRLSSRISNAIGSVVSVALILVVSGTAASQTQPGGAKTSPPSKKAVTKKSAPVPPPKADVLNNQAVLKLVDAGLDEALICAKIRSAEKAEFQLDTDSIIELKNKKVPSVVIRAMMEKSGIAVGDVKPPEAPKPQPQPEPPRPALSGTWSGQMTVEGEPTAMRLVFQKSALGTYSGAIAFQAASGVANSGRIDLREQGAGVLLVAATDAGAQVEFAPSSMSATALSGDAQVRVAGTSGIRKGTFTIAKESDKEDLAEMLRFQNSLGKVIVRQGETWQMTLAPRPQQHAFSRSKAADAKDAAKDVALTQVGTTMAANIGARIATGIPLGGYFAYPVAVLTMIPFLRRNPEIKGFEFEFLRDSKAVIEIKEGPVEFVMPLNQYIPSDANITDVRPVLLQLDVMGTDAVRIVTSRKVTLKTKKEKKFDNQPGFERTELAIEQKVVPADIEKGPNNSFTLRPTSPLAAGEYALAVYGKSPAGGHTENVPLKAQWSSDEMARFLKKGEQWTGYGALAWDFRVVQSTGIVSGAVSGARADSSSNDPSGNRDAKPAGNAYQDSKLKNLKNGETAVVQTALPEADATSKVKAFFNSKDIEFTVNQDTGRIVTDWYGERRCGPGFYRCANRANVRVVSDGGHTILRVQVFERKREGGINEKPWNENSTSKGKETAELAASLEAFIGIAVPISKCYSSQAAYRVSGNWKKDRMSCGSFCRAHRLEWRRLLSSALVLGNWRPTRRYLTSFHTCSSGLSSGA